MHCRSFSFSSFPNLSSGIRLDVNGGMKTERFTVRLDLYEIRPKAVHLLETCFQRLKLSKACVLLYCVRVYQNALPVHCNLIRFKQLPLLELSYIRSYEIRSPWDLPLMDKWSSCF